MPDAKATLRYTLLHLTELVVVVLALVLVRNYLDISTWLTITILVVWVLKDVVLFFKVWRSYVSDDNRPVKQLMGLEATVTAGLDPVGYVRVRGELWKAEVRDPRLPARRGDRARVVDIKGMTLVVERIADH